MVELIADLDPVVTDSEGRQYFATVVAELVGPRWEAWLEFVPTDDSDPLLTDTETHQSSREDVVHWAEVLDDVYIQGAFRRAVAATRDSQRRIPTASIFPRIQFETTSERAEDPFAMYAAGGKDGVRATLRPLTRAELLLIIERFDLNPAKLSLARLSQPQLIVFIATAVEVQLSQGRR